MLAKKDSVLALIFKKKIQEVTSQDIRTIDLYKNLRSSQNQFKRIHLTDNLILLFTVDKNRKHIVFVDILHWDKAYT
jgi:mRNA-degrading endonuclease RelE of RelBE toxin-antitoxin system